MAGGARGTAVIEGDAALARRSARLTSMMTHVALGFAPVRFAWAAGAVVGKVRKEKLPEKRQSPFGRFSVAAAGHRTALLVSK